MVKKNRRTVDIGTDHAFLPVYLVQSGISQRVTACDIGEKPLKNAEKTVKHYGLCDKITLRLSDGLACVRQDEAEEILLCGMGGTLIAEILSGAPFIKRDGVRLILQPMTHSEDVRRYLCENGFAVVKEKAVADSGRLYCCICAEYTGRQGNKEPGYYYFGTLIDSDGAELAFAEKQYERVCKKYNALSRVCKASEEAALLLQVKNYYERRISR